MKEFKIRIHDPAHSVAVQKRLFYLGYAWSGNYTRTQVSHEKAPYLYTNSFGRISYNVRESYFAADKREEITLEVLEALTPPPDYPETVAPKSMREFKFKPLDSVDSHIIQNILFSLGYDWIQEGGKVMHTDRPFLYADSRGEITHGTKPGVFSNNPGRELTRHRLERILGDETCQDVTGAYDEKGNAKHYDHDRICTIEAMERIYGTKAVFHYCEITAFKYRSRVGRKEGADVNQDLVKAKWYEKAAKYYHTKITDGEDTPSDIIPYGLPWED